MGRVAEDVEALEEEVRDLKGERDALREERDDLVAACKDHVDKKDLEPDDGASIPTRAMRAAALELVEFLTYDGPVNSPAKTIGEMRALCREVGRALLAAGE